MLFQSHCCCIARCDGLQRSELTRPSRLAYGGAAVLIDGKPFLRLMGSATRPHENAVGLPERTVARGYRT